MLATALSFCLLGMPPGALPAGDGFLLPTQTGGIGRYQLAIGAEKEFALLKAQAEAQAAKRPPNTIRVLNVVIRAIDAELKNEDGSTFRAVGSLTDEHVARCAEIFEHYQELVFVYTGGALKVEGTQVVRDTPVTAMDSMGGGAWWLSAPTAVVGFEDSLPEGRFDHVSVYYPRPKDLKMGLLGGAVGKDYGVRGAAYWTQWMASIDKPFAPFHGDAVVSVHEWLHNVSSTAHRVMGYAPIPDCHAGEEYGFVSREGGYNQWQAWNRDLMLRITPQGFWYRFTTVPAFQESPPAVNRHVSGGRFFRWAAVSDDFMRKLPWLGEQELAAAIGIPGLTLSVVQDQSNGPFVVALNDPSWSRVASLGYARAQTGRLDSMALIQQRASDAELDDPDGGVWESPIEALVHIRNNRLPKGARDLILIRLDVADAVLPLLKTEGEPAQSRVLGLVVARDPGENHPVNFVAVQVELGDRLPTTEWETLRR